MRHMNRDEVLRLFRRQQEGVREWNALRALDPEKTTFTYETDLTGADLHGLNLINVHLSSTILRGANFDGADLTNAKFTGADLREATFRGARLCHCDFSANVGIETSGIGGYPIKIHSSSAADLSYADLRNADLTLADLSMCDLSYVNLEGSIFGQTTVGCNLTGAKGLESVKHLDRSLVDITSILTMPEEQRESFLRGCGLREQEMSYFSQVLRHGQPTRFYSCFISYSTDDEEFARRLHNDLEDAGILCWKWDHDARTGESIWSEIDRAIRLHDKVVLIASKHSLQSAAVNREITRALNQEDERFRRGESNDSMQVLFPVRVDDYIFDEWQHPRKVDVVDHVIADARYWDRDPAVYARIRDRLIRDLRPGAR
jgi:uncharacterized protein YjbI with pentapeptide repeats